MQVDVIDEAGVGAGIVCSLLVLAQQNERVRDILAAPYALRHLMAFGALHSSHPAVAAQLCELLHLLVHHSDRCRDDVNRLAGPYLLGVWLPKSEIVPAQHRKLVETACLTLSKLATSKWFVLPSSVQAGLMQGGWTAFDFLAPMAASVCMARIGVMRLLTGLKLHHYPSFFSPEQLCDIILRCAPPKEAAAWFGTCTDGSVQLLYEQWWECAVVLTHRDSQLCEQLQQLAPHMLLVIPSWLRRDGGVTPAECLAALRWANRVAEESVLIPEILSSGVVEDILSYSTNTLTTSTDVAAQALRLVSLVARVPANAEKLIQNGSVVQQILQCAERHSQARLVQLYAILALWDLVPLDQVAQAVSSSKELSLLSHVLNGDEKSASLDLNPPPAAPADVADDEKRAESKINMSHWLLRNNVIGFVAKQWMCYVRDPMVCMDCATFIKAACAVTIPDSAPAPGWQQFFDQFGCEVLVRSGQCHPQDKLLLNWLRFVATEVATAVQPASSRIIELDGLDVLCTDTRSSSAMGVFASPEEQLRVCKLLTALCGCSAFSTAASLQVGVGLVSTLPAHAAAGYASLCSAILEFVARLASADANHRAALLSFKPAQQLALTFKDVFASVPDVCQPATQLVNALASPAR